MLAQRIGGDDLVDLVSPAAIIDHQVAELLRNHVVKHIVGDLGVIFGLGEEGLHVIALVVDLGEEGLLVFTGVEVLDHALLTVGALVRNVERGGDDDLVKLLNLAVYGDENLAVFALDLVDAAVQHGGVLQVVVQLLPDVLGAVLPGPEVDLDEVHAGLIVQILQNVSGGNLVKVAVAEGSEGSDPDLLHQGNAVLLAEFLEGQGKVFQIRVHTLDLLAARRHGITVVAALGDAAVTVEVIALVLGLQQFAEGFELLLHLEQPGVLDDVSDSAGERLDHLAGTVLVVAVELRAVVGDAAELFHIVHCIVGRNTHDGAHLIAASVVMRRPALAADAVETLIDGVVLITLLFQVHTRAQAGRTAADDGDANVFVHSFPPYEFDNLVKCALLLRCVNYTTDSGQFHYIFFCLCQNTCKICKISFLFLRLMV